LRVCLIIFTAAAIFGLIVLPFNPGYFGLAVVAGGLFGAGWIFTIKKEGKSAMGYIAIVPIVILQKKGEHHFLTSQGSSSFAYLLVFAAVTFIVGLGIALLYHAIRKRG
jgi:hypothetical protein